MTYGVRNCSFEPKEHSDTVSRTLKQVELAFYYNRPAIISTHRINFCGGLDINNRDKNLRNFKFKIEQKKIFLCGFLLLVQQGRLEKQLLMC